MFKIKKKNVLNVTRKDVLDAIRYNNLIAGAWFDSKFEVLKGDLETGDITNESAIYKPNCTACLVGSTLRRAACRLPRKPGYSKLVNAIENTLNPNYDDYLLQNFDIEIVCTPEVADFQLATKAAKEGNYLGALSHLFEGLVREQYEEIYDYDCNDEYDSDSLKDVKLNNERKKQLRNWVKKNIPVKFQVKL
jgi:hypothetical protein